MKTSSMSSPSKDSPVLRVDGLTTMVHTRSGSYPVVDHVSFTVARGETLGIVGESGSGKSMTALSLLRLNPSPATSIQSGRVVLDGIDLTAASKSQLRRLRGDKVAIILQDPNTALNPVWTVGNQISETLRLHRPSTRRQRQHDVVEALRLLRVSDPELRARSYPHQLSGGMRQRAVGAIALACRPSLLIADEPTTALDVTVQAAFLQHLRDLQRTMDLGILFITHDFAVVAAICDRVGVMYAGELVEMGTVEKVRHRPAHPYTQALLRSVPTLEERPERLVSIPGKPPSVDSYPNGCRYHPRCWLYQRLGEPQQCRTARPTWTSSEPGGAGHACHFGEESQETPLTTGTPQGK